MGEIRVDDAGPVATLWIHNPEHRNALNDALIDALIEAYARLARDARCRALVLRGTDGIFCAGRELRDLRRLQSAPLSLITATYERLRRLNEEVYYCHKPTVAVVERFAFGAGATVASWCDIVVAAETAKFGYPEVHHGIAPTPAMVALLKGIGRKAAMDLLLTGRTIDAREAREIGLVSRLVAPDDLQATVQDIAAQLCRGAPQAQARVKEFTWQCEDASVRASIAAAVDGVSASLAGAEAGEGIEAFFTKRQPPWCI